GSPARRRSSGLAPAWWVPWPSRRRIAYGRPDRATPAVRGAVAATCWALVAATCWAAVAVTCWALSRQRAGRCRGNVLGGNVQHSEASVYSRLRRQLKAPSASVSEH